MWSHDSVIITDQYIDDCCLYNSDLSPSRNDP